jgi:two-component system phosphate regulon sensor histidine kinase PhoR
VVDDIEDTIADGQARQADISMDVPLKRRYKLNISRLPKRMLEPMQVVLEFQEVTLIQRSESMRSEFVANVSHELRSPLATLVGFIETLKDNGDDAQARDRFLDIMDGEAQRMRRLIDDLLSLTNVELREHERPRARINLESVVQEVANALASRARAKNVEILLDIPANLPSAMGDRDQLIQVFNNLMTNALKYGGDGNKIDVLIKPLPDGMSDGGPSVEVWVRDYGQGIEAEHLPRLTERFYRVDKGRSRAVGGTGLGLAIVKHIVNRHRGRLLIESERGKGSLFKVRLPIYREAEPVDPETKL